MFQLSMSQMRSYRSEQRAGIVRRPDQAAGINVCRNAAWLSPPVGTFKSDAAPPTRSNAQLSNNHELIAVEKLKCHKIFFLSFLLYISTIVSPISGPSEHWIGAAAMILSVGAVAPVCETISNYLDTRAEYN